MSQKRGGGPATTISSPSHIFLIFSSEPPRNPRPSIIMCFKVLNSLRYNYFFLIWIGCNLQTHENDFKLYLGKTSSASVIANLRDIKQIAKYLAHLCLSFSTWNHPEKFSLQLTKKFYKLGIFCGILHQDYLKMRLKKVN